MYVCRSKRLTWVESKKGGSISPSVVIGRRGAVYVDVAVVPAIDLEDVGVHVDPRGLHDEVLYPVDRGVLVAILRIPVWKRVGVFIEEPHLLVDVVHSPDLDIVVMNCVAMNVARARST